MPRSAPVDALVWRRSDFRETSRVVTLLTRESGKLTCLAKGAHRQDSPLLGKLDFLNLLRVELWKRGETMPLLGRTLLLHEPRGLRRPSRYLLAAHLASIVDRALPDQRPDPALFDLLSGGLTLLERCPESALLLVIAGLEWRALRALGMQPSLTTCAESGRALPTDTPLDVDPNGRGFLHPDANADAARPRAARRPAGRVSVGAVRLLGKLHETPGRAWPALEVAAADLRGALALLGRWVGLALDHLPPLRAAALRLAADRP